MASEPEFTTFTDAAGKEKLAPHHAEEGGGRHPKRVAADGCAASATGP